MSVLSFSRRLAALTATAAVVGSGAVALTTTAADAANPVSGVCKIQVLGADDEVIGYVGALDPGYGVVPTATESTASTFDVAPGSRQELFDHASGDRIGLVYGASGSSFAAGSPGYGWFARVDHTGPGAPPESGSSSVFDGNPAESSVWTLGQDGSLTPTWINPGGAPAPSTVFVDSVDSVKLLGCR